MTLRRAQTNAAASRALPMPTRDNRRMFNSIARRYDLMNALLSLGLDRIWRRKAVEILDPRDGGRYLDVGCGTGGMAIEILRRAPGATVVGIDPAEGMLEIAARRIQKTTFADSVALQVGDGMELAFDDGSFTGVVSVFCIRNMADRTRAFSKMRRTLTPDGKAVIMELAVPDNPIVHLGHRLYTRWFVPLAGCLVARNEDAYQYLVDSINDFPQPPVVLAEMHKAGFTHTHHIPLHGGMVRVYVGLASQLLVGDSSS